MTFDADRLPDAIRMALDRALVLVETLEPGLSLRDEGDHFDILTRAGEVLAQVPRDWLRCVDADRLRACLTEIAADRGLAERKELLAAASEGDVEIHDLPFDGEVAVRVGGHVYVIDRTRCLA